MSHSRRRFLAAAPAATLAAAGLPASGWAGQTNPARANPPPPPRASNRIAVASYSFWQFRHAELRDLERCIDLAAEWGFDGFEILHRQMTNEKPECLQRLKRRAFVNGLDLCGFSTHQGFLSGAMGAMHGTHGTDDLSS